MDRNEWYRAGEDIRDQVQQAVDTGNFTDLGKNIGDTVNGAFNHTVREVNRTVGTMGESLNRTVELVGDSLERTVETVSDSINRAIGDAGRGAFSQVKDGGSSGGFGGNANQAQISPYASSPLYKRPNIRPDAKLFQRVPKGTVSGVMCMGAGFGVMGISALALIGSVGELVSYHKSVTPVIISGIFTAAGLWLGCHGASLSGRVKRYKRYVDMVKEKLYCPVKELAKRIGKSERFVVRDLKKMIHAGMFKQAHLDQKETCLIASDAMYDQYMIVQKDYEEQQRRLEREKQEGERKKQERARLGEGAEVIEEGQGYVRLIRQCNDEIPGEEMSDKLDRLELQNAELLSAYHEKASGGVPRSGCPKA